MNMDIYFGIRAIKILIIVLLYSLGCTALTLSIIAFTNKSINKKTRFTLTIIAFCFSSFISCDFIFNFALLFNLDLLCLPIYIMGIISFIFTSINFARYSRNIKINQDGAK
jgi:hypothetical protein